MRPRALRTAPHGDARGIDHFLPSHPVQSMNHGLQRHLQQMLRQTGCAEIALCEDRIALRSQRPGMTPVSFRARAARRSDLPAPSGFPLLAPPSPSPFHGLRPSSPVPGRTMPSIAHVHHIAEYSVRQSYPRQAVPPSSPLFPPAAWDAALSKWSRRMEGDEPSARPPRHGILSSSGLVRGPGP